MFPYATHSFQDLEPLRAHLVRLAPEAGYVSLQDRSDPHKTEGIGKFRFDLDWARSRGFVDAQEAEAVDTHELLAAKAWEWVQDTARDHTDQAERKFRVRVFGPKGHDCIHSMHFRCVFEGDDEPMDPTELAVLDLDPEDVETRAAAGAMTAIGRAYEDLSRNVQSTLAVIRGAYGHIGVLHVRQIDQLRTQLEDARGQVDRLVDHVLSSRAEAIETEEARLASERERVERAHVAQHAVDQLSNTAKTLFLAHKGLPPEVLELGEKLQDRPELLKLLTDPSVQAVLEQPGVLDQVALQLQALAAAMSPETTP